MIPNARFINTQRCLDTEKFKNMRREYAQVEADLSVRSWWATGSGFKAFPHFVFIQIWTEALTTLSVLSRNEGNVNTLWVMQCTPLNSIFAYCLLVWIHWHWLKQFNFFWFHRVSKHRKDPKTIRQESKMEVLTLHVPFRSAGRNETASRVWLII